MVASLSFGVHRNKPLEEVPTRYLRWALSSAECLSWWQQQAIRQELDRRGRPVIDAAPVLQELEELLLQRITTDVWLSHLDPEDVGRITDLHLVTFEEVRCRYGATSGATV